MNVYKKKLIVIDKNNAKERLHNAVLKVNELCQTLKAKVSEEHYLLIQSATEKSRENEFVKKKEHLTCKFNELQTTSSKRNNQQIKTIYIKPSGHCRPYYRPYVHCINKPSNILIKFRTKVCSNRKENTFYGNYYSNRTSSIKLGIPQ